MDEERWDALVGRLEERARRNPRAYRRRVSAMGALGYLYIAVALTLLLGLAGGIVYAAGSGHSVGAVRLLIPLAVTSWAIVRSLAVRIDPPRASG